MGIDSWPWAFYKVVRWLSRDKRVWTVFGQTTLGMTSTAHQRVEIRRIVVHFLAHRSGADRTAIIVLIPSGQHQQQVSAHGLGLFAPWTEEFGRFKCVIVRLVSHRYLSSASIFRFSLAGLPDDRFVPYSMINCTYPVTQSEMIDKGYLWSRLLLKPLM